MHPRSLTDFARAQRAARLIIVCAMGALVLGSSPAGAAEDPENLIRQGVALRRQGEEAKAHGYFQRAYEIAHTPRTAAQLGLSDLAVGAFLDAQSRLSEALATTDPWVAEHKRELNRSCDDARSKLGKVILEGVPSTAAVTVGDRAPITLGLDGAIWVPPGTVRLKIEAAGAPAIEREVTLAAGESRHLRVAAESPRSLAVAPAATDLPGSADEAHAVVPSVDDSSPGAVPAPQSKAGASARAGIGWRGPLFWGALAGAAGLVTLGVYETVHYGTLLDDFNDPHRTPPCGQSGNVVAGGKVCERLVTDGDTARKLAVIGYVGGGLLAVTALVLKLTEPTRESTPEQASSVACAPWLSNVGGATCLLRF